MKLFCQECHREFQDSELDLGHANCPRCGGRQVRRARVSPSDPNIEAVALELIGRGELSAEAARTGLSLIHYARKIEQTLREDLRVSLGPEHNVPRN